MKRPRESQQNRNEEDLFSGWVTPFRQWNSCCSDRHRRQCHRSSHRERIFGSCLITTLMVQVVVGLLLLLAIIPAINASSEVDTMFTMNNKFEYNNNYQQQQNNIRERRKQQQQQQQEHQRFLEDEEPKISPKAAADDFTLDLLSSSSSSDVECKSMGKCERCTFSEQKTYDSCKDTGRWEKFECTMAEALETSKSEDENPVFGIELRSCKYTEFDEGIAMFRLEIFCFLIGALAIISVKKQKRLSTSLFDQRKREATNTVANGNRSFSVSENDDEIEFTPMTNQQKEMVSLMESNNNNDHMEII